MAAQKKNNTSKATPSTKKTVTSTPRSKGNGNGKNNAAAAREAENRTALHRIYGGCICILLALLGFIGFFPQEAILIAWFRVLCRGLLGYGYWLTPFCLVLAAVLLFRTKHSPYRLRVTAALLTPLVMSVLIMACVGTETYPETFMDIVKQLWADGQELYSGGVIAGGLTLLMGQFLGRVVTVILMLVLQLALVLVICHRTPADVVEGIRTMKDEMELRREERYAEEDEGEQLEIPPLPTRRKNPGLLPGTKEQEKAAEEGSPKRRSNPLVDVPMAPEEPAPVGPEREIPDPLAVFKKGKKGKKEPVMEPALKQEEELDYTILGPDGRPLEKQETSASPVEALPEEKVEKDPAIAKVKASEAAAEAKKVASEVDSVLEQPLPEYTYPPIDLLAAPKPTRSAGIKEELAATQARLEDTIQSFGIDAHIISVTRGPTVARFELELDRGVKLSKLTNLSEDIALSLGVSGVRIAPVPDKMSVVGIEVPNRVVSPVPIREVLDSEAFKKTDSKIAFAVGKNISGECVIGNIGKLPHLLIAGTTGSGKSVCINSLLVSLLYKASPQEVRLIMVDPKKVELGIYNGIPHLLIPVVTEPKKAAGALQWAVLEMMKRYTTFSEVGVRKLEDYNRLAAADPDREVMPAIVVVIDELADLMIVAAKEVEESICRIAQLGRAAGMHLVVATQRPSADVITGLMKANIPSRISFSVASAMESRIILDNTGAEKLVGRGDMLYSPIGSGKPQRVQGCLINDEDVEAVVDFVKQNGESCYDENVIREVAAQEANTGKGSKGGSAPAPADAGGMGDFDELLPDGVDVILETGQASVSMLQRRLKLGYARAARLVDQMEELGFVGPFEGSKPRQVKITKEEWAVKRAELTGEEPEQLSIPLDGEPIDDEPPFDPDEDVLEEEL